LLKSALIHKEELLESKTGFPPFPSRDTTKRVSSQPQSLSLLAFAIAPVDEPHSFPWATHGRKALQALQKRRVGEEISRREKPRTVGQMFSILKVDMI
jgi:hypothetical protein